MPEILEKLFVPCKESHDTVSTPARKKELRDWYSTNRLAGILPGMKLPQIGGLQNIKPIERLKRCRSNIPGSCRGAAPVC